ncbi:MAG: efflux RND transporter permease subunit [candidate division Zixibacteria bacterium]|nr:efflux RND transporter permease subunit [candidate division Zixibacteria bacterium]
MRLIETGSKNPYLLVVVLLAVLVIGFVSASKLPVDLLPAFKTPAVQILTFYPGMPPEVMERDIMSRMERWTGQSVGIQRQEGRAMLGFSVVKDFFREGISLETAMSQVSSYAMSDLYYLPPGTVPPMVMPFDPTASLPLCLISVSSPGMSEKELYDIAYFELRNRLQSIQGVIAPAVYGGVLRRILAYVDRDKLEACGMSPMDVVEALRRQNVLIPAGDIKAGTLDYQIFTNAMPSEVAQLNDIPIKIVDGRPVFLRDVARVEDSHQIQSNIVRVNGRRQVYIPVYRQPGANTLAIVSSIRENIANILQRLREMNPKAQDLSLEVVLDQSIYVRGAIRGLLFAGGLGALLAALIVFAFLRSLGSTAIVGIAVPFSVLGALIGLFYAGHTLNAMTLGGLALAIGILIDHAIVTLENIVRHVHAGAAPQQAAVVGVQEVALPLLVSTITFVVVFYPVVFLSGMARFLFTPLAVAATLANIVSYFFALIMIPAYCAHFLRPASVSGPKENGLGWMTRLSHTYGGLVDRILAYRRIVVVSAIVLFAGAILATLTLGRELFPAVDAHQFQLQIRLPSGTRIEETEQTILAVEQEITALAGEPDPGYPKDEMHPESDLRMLISNIGVLMDWPAAYTSNSGPMDAFILAQLKGKRGHESTFALVSELRRILREKHPGAEFSFDTGGLVTSAMNLGESAPIHLQVAGSDLKTSNRIAQIIIDDMSALPGIADPRIAQRLDYPVVKVDIDRTKAAFAGLNASDVVTNLVTATNSSVNFRPAFWIDERNGNHYFIGAQYPEADLASFETIKDIPLTGEKTDRPVLLGNVAEISRGTGPSQINHSNITRVIDVYANVHPDIAVGTAADKVEERLRGDSRLKFVHHSSDRGDYYDVAGEEFAGKGYTVSVSGEVNIMRDAFRQFGAGLVIATLLVYLVMVAQLRSFIDPFIVMLAVPLGFIGVAATLWATGTALSIQSFMGIIMMVGIVVQYSILMIDFANRLVRSGRTVQEAITEAARSRLRPILMTSLAAILALLPMAIGLEGGEVNTPLARAIIGGVLGSSLILLVLPCLYVMLKRPSRAVVTNVPSRS